MRRGREPAGAILGFANYLLRFYQVERPRAVLVGWDTLTASTYRHEEFPAYQSGREFDDAIVEQLEIIPEFVAACGFANAKAAGYEADDFLAAAVSAEERRGGTVLVASGDRDSFQLASDVTTILFPVRGGDPARIGPAEVRERYGVDPSRSRISSPCAAIRQTSCRALRGSDQKARPTSCAGTARSRACSRPAFFPSRPSSCGSFARSPP